MRPSRTTVSAPRGDTHVAAPPKPRLSGVPLLIVAIGVVLFVQALFVFSYIGALHHPKPHKVAFGVVGTSPLPVAVGTQFSLKTTPYASEADALERDRSSGRSTVPSSPARRERS